MLSGSTAVDRDDPASWRFQVGLKPEGASFVADECVGGVLFVQQLDDLRVRVLQVLVEDSILWVRSLRNVDDEEAPILGDLGAEVPIFVILPLIDQLVLRLRCSEFVEVEFVKIVRLFQLLG